MRISDWSSDVCSSDLLIEALPGLAEHGCSYREPGGFIRRMREGEGTWLGHVLEHVAIELPNMAGEDVTFGKTRSIHEDRPGVYSVISEYAQQDAGIGAGERTEECRDGNKVAKT